MTIPLTSRSSKSIDDLAELSTRAELSEFTGVAAQTFARWAVEGTGPKITRLGRAVRYRRRDIAAWLDESREQATA